MSGVAAPPLGFSSRPLVLRTEAAGGLWRRLYLSRHPDPLGFGLAPSRFSDPTGRPFGVVYLGSSIKVAFNEVILRDRADGRAGSVPIPLTEIEAYTCGEIAVATELRLVDLTGDGGLRMGVPSDVVGARDQTAARLWSAAFHAHPSRVDGVYHPSRLNEERNIALYDRALPKLTARATRSIASRRGGTSSGADAALTQPPQPSVAAPHHAVSRRGSGPQASRRSREEARRPRPLPRRTDSLRDASLVAEVNAGPQGAAATGGSVPVTIAGGPRLARVTRKRLSDRAEPEAIPAAAARPGSLAVGFRPMPADRSAPTLAHRLFSPPARRPAPRGRWRSKTVLRSGPALRCGPAGCAVRLARHPRSAIARGSAPRPDRRGSPPCPRSASCNSRTTPSYKGQLKTLSIRAEIEITPNRAKRAGTDLPDLVVQSSGIEIGAGWMRTGEVSGREYVSLSLAAPEFGPRRILANLGRAAGQDDEGAFAVIWNPRN